MTSQVQEKAGLVVGVTGRDEFKRSWRFIVVGWLGLCFGKSGFENSYGAFIVPLMVPARHWTMSAVSAWAIFRGPGCDHLPHAAHRYGHGPDRQQESATARSAVGGIGLRQRKFSRSPDLDAVSGVLLRRVLRLRGPLGLWPRDQRCFRRQSRRPRGPFDAGLAATSGIFEPRPATGQWSICAAGRQPDFRR